MDPIRNPYAPGAGTPPPELTGRDELREQVRIALERVRIRRPTKSYLIIGLRGVGKTVLLERLRLDAEAAGIQTMRVEAPESRSLPAMLAPQLRQALLRLSRNEQARDLAIRALRGLAGFASALKVKYNDIEVGLDFDPEPGLADNGDLEQDLQTLLEVVGEAAAQVDTVMAIFVDEMQYVAEQELAALITALHRAAQLQLHVVLFGAGLPQLPGQMGNAKSYAERLFSIASIGPLPAEDAKAALAKPARRENVEFDSDALDRIFEETQGHPYFVQEWGKHCWETSDASPITLADVENASQTAIASLDEGFFRIRFDRLTPTERRYLRAMAELGPGPHRSGDIAEVLEREVKSVAPMRSNLIQKGMIWSPSHGDTAFTVPMFDAFMYRIMPGDDWRA
jgi:predicted transcriptional regulator